MMTCSAVEVSLNLFTNKLSIYKNKIDALETLVPNEPNYMKLLSQPNYKGKETTGVNTKLDADFRENHCLGYH